MHQVLNALVFRLCLLALFTGLGVFPAVGQQSMADTTAHQQKLPLLQPADSLHKGRFLTCAIGGAAIYTGFSIGLYNVWYKNYDLVGFHTFNDWGEWKDMDKAGHFITTYTETRLIYSGARWTGMRRKPALLTSMAVGSFLQATVEVMDGFSAKWGFSWADVGFNTLGTTLFAGQEWLWNEQRISLKASYTAPAYPSIPAYSADLDAPPVTLRQRAADLYGVNVVESFLKDYNGLTIWASVNPSSFFSDKQTKATIRWPRWLNIAVGYGAENLYGGFENEWTDSNGFQYAIDGRAYPRYRQFYLSLDVDLDRIRTRSRFLKTLLHTLNWVKIPAPALEINTLGKVKMHYWYW